MEVAIIVCVGWMLSVCFHEFGHAIVAYWGGDKSVKEKGYLTFNIFKYTDPGVTLVFPILILMLGGIALPGAAVYINHRNLRSRMWESAVSAAGPFATLLCAIVFALPFLWSDSESGLYQGLAFLVSLEIYALILNSLPLPPFDGFGVIEPWLPEAIGNRIRNASNIGLLIVFLLIWGVPQVNGALWAVSYALTDLLGIPRRLIAQGGHLFSQNSMALVIGLVIALFLAHRSKKQPAQASATPAMQQYSAAKQLLQQNRPLDAIDALNQCLREQPDFAEGWQLRGVCFGLMNRNDEAKQNFDRAIQINPQYGDAWYNRACCLALQGRYDDALGDLAQAIKLEPQSLKDHARQDVGFRPLWNDERFKQLTAG